MNNIPSYEIMNLSEMIRVPKIQQNKYVRRLALTLEKEHHNAILELAELIKYRDYWICIHDIPITFRKALSNWNNLSNIANKKKTFFCMLSAHSILKNKNLVY